MELRAAILQTATETRTLLPNQYNSFDDLYVDFQQESIESGLRVSLFLHPKQDVVLQRVELQYAVKWPENARFFANGYQSWSESTWLPLNGKMPRLRPIARKRMGLYGDDAILNIPHGAGNLHAWTYCQVDLGNGQQQLIGSTSEKTGFTLFLYNHQTGILTIRKDLEQLGLSHSFPLMEIWARTGQPKELFDPYFAQMEIPKVSARKAIGWTSWYQYFTNINADLLLKELEGFSTFIKDTQPSDCEVFFQIDDGWQTAIGDWRSANVGFPQGMAAMAQAIRKEKMQPGLWLAPFIAASHSELVQKHPDWLLKDAKGKRVIVGWNPLWKPKPGLFRSGGWYYALDFYNPQVQDYLSGVFHIMLKNWGFELLKLDFLFAVCLAPPPGKTRGQVMHEAMVWLRKQMGDHKMLVCGVPLGAAFGLADYGRIGGDVHLAWDNPLLRWLGHREMVSTLASLRNTLGRWPLHQRAFLNDPDVFILRSNDQQLTPTQQYTVLIINALLGGVLFTSDSVAAYTGEQISEYQEALELLHTRVMDVKMLAPDVYQIDFQEPNGNIRAAFCNLNAKPVHFQTVSGTLMELQAYESML
ncbi:MAG: glycoside hydrolase family 36 protein [Saprospiraceae bacterium]|nr:glycoside hydrolase family 36 protein [Saprospiraceae bacterium]